MALDGSKECFPKSSVPLLQSNWEGEDGTTPAFHEFNSASFPGAVFNLYTTIVGAGIMALPATMKVLGLVPGLVMIVLAALLTNTSIKLLVRFSRAVDASSYLGVGAGGWSKNCYCQVGWGTYSVPKLFPSVPDMASVWELFTAVPVLVTAYGCHYNVHQIHNELKDSSQMESIVHTSLILCSTVYMTTSFFGYLLFGESTLSDVLANFDSNLGIPYGSVLNDVIRVSYAVHLMLVFPVIFHALRLNLDGLLFPSSRPLSFDNKRFAVMTAILLLMIFLCANFIPNIWDIFQFTGATAAACFEFIFPAAITLRDPHSVAKKWDKILAVVMIVLAVVSNVGAVYSDTYKMFHRRVSPSRA